MNEQELHYLKKIFNAIPKMTEAEKNHFLNLAKEIRKGCIWRSKKERRPPRMGELCRRRREYLPPETGIPDAPAGG